MTPKEYKEMMAYLTRSGVSKQVTFASDIARPDPKPEIKEIEAFNEFNKRNPQADGGRIGFEKGSIPKGYINLSQLGEKVGLPEKIVTNPKTGKKRSLGGLRQRIIDTLTRTPSAERGNLKTKDFINNVLVKELDLKKIDLGQGQPTYIIKDPKVKQLDTLKEYFLRKGFKYGITQETANNMKKFYNDPTLKKYIRKGEFVPDKILKARGIGENQAANITFRLAQHLNGKKFANVNVDLPVNKFLAKKIFKEIEKAPFGNPYQLTAYKEAQNIITNELGPEYFNKTNLETMKREARRILNKEGVPTYNPTIKGSTGFNVNEIIGIKTGARVKGLAPYSQFINIMEGKLNTAQYANFVRQFEKFNNRMQIENKSDVIKDYKKYTKKFLENNPSVKETDLPKFSLKSPEKIYGKKRIAKLTNDGINLKSSFDDIGYTIDVGKKTRTLKEFITDPKNVSRFKDFQGSVGFAANPMFSPGILKEAFKQLPTFAGAGALNLAFGVDPTSAIDRASISAEAALAPQLVKQAAKLGTTGQKVANLFLSPKMAMRVARVASPIGIASLVGEGAYQAGKFAKKRIGELKAMSPEQRQELRSEGARQAFDPFMAAGGGIAKEAGDSSGPPPESGPNSQGLPGLLKRVRNL